MTALTTAMLVAAFAPTAGAKIVPQVGIGGIELEMTVAEVIDERGNPDVDRVLDNEIIGPERELKYGKTTALFAGAGDDAPLIGVITKKKSERTAGGSGIGTTEEALVEDIPRLKCSVDFGLRHCLLGKLRAGRTVTDFVISKQTGRVTRITVAIVID